MTTCAGYERVLGISAPAVGVRHDAAVQHDAAADRRPKRRRRLSVRDVGRICMAEAARRKPILAVLAFNIALVLAMFAALLSVTTFVPSVERQGLLWACGFAASSVGLVLFSLPRMPRGLRFLGAGVLGLAAFGGLSSAGRMLGW